MADRSRGWVLQDIAWDKFDGTQVDPDLLKVAKAAALVEYNGDAYARYLAKVFRGDREFCDTARQWGAEETRHGAALRAWAERADPQFDFDRCFEIFSDVIQLPQFVDNSVRGSRCGELVSRCIVEVGTSSFYTALADASSEPVFTEICRRIAADEVRHYKLFYSALTRYQTLEGIGPIRRAWVALCRIGEIRDDELPFAYFAANAPADRFSCEHYDRRQSARAYAGRAFRYYRPGHVQRALVMIFQTLGWDAHRGTARWLANRICQLLSWRVRHISSAR